MPEQQYARTPTDTLDVDPVNDSSSRAEKQSLPEVRTRQIDVFLSALLESGTTRRVRTSPLEWVAATGIYFTHVVDNIERNTSNVGCE